MDTLQAFESQYGQRGEHLDEETWLAWLGIWISGWQAAREQAPVTVAMPDVNISDELIRYEPIYTCIVADPPWTPKLGATWATRFTDKARPQKHYRTLSVDEIICFAPPAAKQSHLWLWVLNQHIDWGYEVARAWGFEPIQMITWAKPGLGCGQFQCNTEHCLLCRKGSRQGNPFGCTGGTWFNWPRGRHSEKPKEFYSLVERVSPGPYFEMFARRERERWTCWGDEADALPVRDNIQLSIPSLSV